MRLDVREGDLHLRDLGYSKDEIVKVIIDSHKLTIVERLAKCQDFVRASS